MENAYQILAGKAEAKILNEGITMCLEIKYYNKSVRQHKLNYLFIV